MWLPMIFSAGWFILLPKAVCQGDAAFLSKAVGDMRQAAHEASSAGLATVAKHTASLPSIGGLGLAEIKADSSSTTCGGDRDWDAYLPSKGTYAWKVYSEGTAQRLDKEQIWVDRDYGGSSSDGQFIIDDCKLSGDFPDVDFPKKLLVKDLVLQVDSVEDTSTIPGLVSRRSWDPKEPSGYSSGMDPGELPTGHSIDLKLKGLVSKDNVPMSLYYLSKRTDDSGRPCRGQRGCIQVKIQDVNGVVDTSPVSRVFYAWKV